MLDAGSMKGESLCCEDQADVCIDLGASRSVLHAQRLTDGWHGGVCMMYACKHCMQHSHWQSGIQCPDTLMGTRHALQKAGFRFL